MGLQTESLSMQRSLAHIAVLSALVAVTGCITGSGALPEPQPPKVTVTTPISREVRDIDEYTGRIEAVQTVDVRARVSGYLQEVYFKDGDFVKEGANLFLIDPRTYKAADEQAKAKTKLFLAKYQFAEATRKRRDELYKKRVISKEEYEQAIAEEAEAKAAWESAIADEKTNALNLEFTTIKAEIAGRIDRTFVTKGNLVQSGPGATLLTRIVSVDPIYAYFNPDQLAFLRYTRRRIADDGKMEVQHVRDRKMEATIVLADGSTYPDKGIVDFASNIVDPSTGTIQVRAEFPNTRRALTPGLFVRLQIAAEKVYPALLVPERAINTDQSDKFVYVVDAQGVAQRKNVQLGTKQGRLRVIKEGLTATDKVVISGGLLVRPGLKVNATDGKIDESPEPQPASQPKPVPVVKPKSSAS
jgi:RND family efflux transporter MFP subunit